ncbi:Cilia- and flagella-associated protein 70, partial [Cladochytrium tenue]
LGLAMQTFKKVAWPQPYVAWLPPDAVVRLREMIIAKKPIEIEFTRELQPKFSHLTDVNSAKYHGKVSVDLSVLLYPRVVGMKGRFAADVFEGNLVPNSDAAGGEPTGGARKGAKPRDEIDPALYKNLGTHVGLEISLDRILLDKKKLQPVTKSVNDFIPRRTIPYNQLFQKKAARADDEFRTQVQEVVRSLVQEYQHVLQTDLQQDGALVDEFEVVNTLTPQDEVKRHKKFLYHLNKSGAYFALKEQLKVTVVGIVRERFLRKNPFASKAEIQLFMSEIYVYLVDQMHIAINKMFKDLNNAFVDPTASRTADFNMLKEFADGAEFDNNIPTAESYHKERVAKFEDSMQAWFDYGAFCLRNGMRPKGLECFREVLSRNPKHIPSLLAYGALCSCTEKFDEARVYLVTAADLQPKYFLARVVLGLHYEAAGEENEAESVLAEAARLKPADAPCMYLQAGQFLASVHAGPLAVRSLAHSLVQAGSSVQPYLQLAQLERQQGDVDAAVGHVQDALRLKEDDPDVWAALGHVQYAAGRWADAAVSYETVLSLPTEPRDVGRTYERLGNLHLRQCGAIVGDAAARPPAEVDHAKRAKSLFLRGCEAGQSARGWLGVGRACMVLGSYAEAEDAFAEANVLNNRDSDVWAHLALLCLLQERRFEANQCVAQALRHGARNAEILTLIGARFLELGEAAPAAESLRVALELDPGSDTTRELFERAVRVDGVGGGGGDEGDGFEER